MKVKVTAFWEGFICGLSAAHYSHSAIVKRCKEEGLIVSKAGVGLIIRRCAQQAPAVRGRPEIVRRTRPQPARTPNTVRAIRTAVTQEDPPMQRSLAIRHGISNGTVSNIIRTNLALEARHKARGHRLTERHIQERFTNARKLYETYLAWNKWQWVCTLDEGWLYLDDTNRVRSIFYRPTDHKSRSDFVLQCKEKFAKGFLVVAGYCSRGTLPLVQVPSNTKVNTAYFQENVMDPLYDAHIPHLYGDETTNVWIHMDKASSHTARSSQSFYARKAEETGIRVIPFSSIPVKSPDASPMDYCGFGLLKQALARRRPRTLQGLRKVATAVWRDIPLPILRSSLLQWKLRCRAIVRARGRHIEHNRWWRRGIY